MNRFIRLPFFCLLFIVTLSSLHCGGGGGSSTDDGGTTPGGSDDDDSPVAVDGSTGDPYDIGTPTLSEVYVSPTGSDSNSGTSVSSPLETLTAAWASIPDTMTSTGYRINLLPGEYPCGADESSCVNYFDNKTGTFAFPVIIQSVDAAGTYAAGEAIIRGGMDINSVSYLYLIGVEMRADDTYPINNSGNNVLHFAASDNILMREITLAGSAGHTDTTSHLQEVLKINQGTDIYLEDSDLNGTYQTTLDYFSVQGGHILNSRIHGSGGRCAYLKGGSAYFRVEGNEFYDCVEAGFQAGESANFNLMQDPWIHYEAYDVKFINNLVHDIDGAGFGVAGGYNVLLAYNTLYRIGLTDDGGRDWTLAQFIHGGRHCVTVEEFGGEAGSEAQCQAYLDLGGWGTADSSGGSDEWIPNKNVYVYNNIFYNPTGVSTTTSHFVFNGNATLGSDAENIPDPSMVDDNLVIRGNVIWNGDAGIALRGTTNGSEPSCDNATCSEAQLLADNAINTTEPQLTDPASSDFTLTATSNILTATAYTVPDFTWDTFPTGSDVPGGTLSNVVTENRDGEPRTGADHPGAY